MRTFVSALLAATALAQSSSNSTSNSTSATDSIKQAVADVTSWLLGKTKDYLGSDSQKKAFPDLVAATNTTLGLKGSFSLDNTKLGVNFVTAAFEVSG